MLEKSIFFSRIPKYLYDKDKTPYFTRPKHMSLLQSQYELFSYGVFVGIISLFIFTAALFSFINSNGTIYIFWMILTSSLIISIHFTIKKYISVCSYFIALAPLMFLLKLMYDELLNIGSFFKLALLSILIVIFIKYGIRIIKIVHYQNKKNVLE